MGVHCKSSNDACRAELSRLPLKSKILFSSIKFYDHIISSDNTLVQLVYIATKTRNSWVGKIKRVIQNLGYSFLAEGNIPLKPHLHSIKRRIQDHCLQEQNSNICNNSKLKFFQSVYCMGDRPPYVDLLKNVCDRSALCKIRISAHPLMIERGRHLKILSNERFCPVCKTNQIEDEQHFLLHCDGFASQREAFEHKIHNLLKPKKHSRANEKINFIINNSSALALKLSSSFISNCLIIRKTFI